MNLDEIVYRLWFVMSHHGHVDLTQLTKPDERRAARLMVRARVARVHRGQLRQSPLAAQVDRWTAVQ